MDRNYVKLMHSCLIAETYPAIATHDDVMIQEALAYTRTHGITPDRFEVSKMLYGVRRMLQRRVVEQGYRLRLYVPYGAAWYPISCAAWPNVLQTFGLSRKTSRVVDVYYFQINSCGNLRACAEVNTANALLVHPRGQAGSCRSPLRNLVWPVGLVHAARTCGPFWTLAVFATCDLRRSCSFTTCCARILFLIIQDRSTVAGPVAAGCVCLCRPAATPRCFYSDVRRPSTSASMDTAR